MPGAQVIRKETLTGPWHRDFLFGPDYVSVEALGSITFTRDATGVLLPQPVTLLLAGPFHCAEPFHTGIWARQDDAAAPLADGTLPWIGHVFSEHDNIARTDVDNYHRSNAHIRAVGFHRDAVTGIEHVFAGDAMGRIWSGVYDAAAPQKISWNGTHENPGIDAARVMGFAEADGALYASITPQRLGELRGGLYRRNDGPTPTWTQLWNWWVDDGDRAYPLRGLTGVPAPDGSARQVLIGGQEEPGQMQRFDPAPGVTTAAVELDYAAYFSNLWGSLGRNHPIAAFNDVLPVSDPLSSEPLCLIGMWVSDPGYHDPPHNGDHCLIRHADGIHYEWLRVFDYQRPIPAGEEFKGSRTLCVSPFAEDAGLAYYVGGFDTGSGPISDTAWICRAIYPGRTVAPPYQPGSTIDKWRNY